MNQYNAAFVGNGKSERGQKGQMGQVFLYGWNNFKEGLKG